MFPRIFPVVGSLLVVFLMFAAPQMSQASRQFPGYFHIINAATHEVLECKTLPDGQTLLHPGAHVGTPNQEWEILGAGQDRFKIINRAFHFVLELKTGDHINGADILAAVETQGAEQLWTLTEHQPNQFSIRNLVSGKPLEIQPSLGRFTDRIQQWNFYGGPNQLWQIQRIPEFFTGVHFVENEFVRVGVDADCGGAICWISEQGSDRNVVNTKDMGRYIQQSYYAGEKRNRQTEGQSPFWSPFPWNPLQAGDYYGNRSLVMDLKIEGQALYVKTRPMLWDMNHEYADAYFETWIELDGKEVIYHGKLTRFEGDETWGMQGHPQELPACYLSSDLNQFFSYTGNEIWNYHLNSIPSKKVWEDWITHESWIACVDTSLWGFSVYFPGVATFSGGFYNGADAIDSTSYFAPRLQVELQPFDDFEFRVYFNLGPLNEMMHRIYLRRHKNQLIALGALSE